MERLSSGEYQGDRAGPLCIAAGEEVSLRGRVRGDLIVEREARARVTSVDGALHCGEESQVEVAGGVQGRSHVLAGARLHVRGDLGGRLEMQEESRASVDGRVSGVIRTGRSVRLHVGGRAGDDVRASRGGHFRFDGPIAGRVHLEQDCRLRCPNVEGALRCGPDSIVDISGSLGQGASVEGGAELTVGGAIDGDVAVEGSACLQVGGTIRGDVHAGARAVLEVWDVEGDVVRHEDARITVHGRVSGRFRAPGGSESGSRSSSPQPLGIQDIMDQIQGAVPRYFAGLNTNFLERTVRSGLENLEQVLEQFDLSTHWDVPQPSPSAPVERSPTPTSSPAPATEADPEDLWDDPPDLDLSGWDDDSDSGSEDPSHAGPWIELD